MEGGKLKPWEKLYWGVFAVAMASLLFNRLSLWEKEPPKVLLPSSQPHGMLAGRCCIPFAAVAAWTPLHGPATGLGGLLCTCYCAAKRGFAWSTRCIAFLACRASFSRQPQSLVVERLDIWAKPGQAPLR